MKRTWRLFIYGKRKAFGVYEYVQQIPSIFQAKVTSEYAKLYRISNNLFSRIIKEEKNCEKSLKNYAKKELITLFSRVVELRNSQYELLKERFCYNANSGLNFIRPYSINKESNPFLENVLSCEFNLETTRLYLDQKSIDKPNIHSRGTDSLIFLTDNSSGKLSKVYSNRTHLNSENSCKLKGLESILNKVCSNSLLREINHIPSTETLSKGITNNTNDEYLGNTLSLEKEPISRCFSKISSFGDITIRSTKPNPFLNKFRYIIQKKKKKIIITNKEKIYSHQSKETNNLESTEPKSDNYVHSIKTLPEFKNRLKLNYVFRNIRSTISNNNNKKI